MVFADKQLDEVTMKIQPKTTQNKLHSW